MLVISSSQTFPKHVQIGSLQFILTLFYREDHQRRRKFHE